jgi:hypothetical protein
LLAELLGLVVLFDAVLGLLLLPRLFGEGRVDVVLLGPAVRGEHGYRQRQCQRAGAGVFLHHVEQALKFVMVCLDHGDDVAAHRSPLREDSSVRAAPLPSSDGPIHDHGQFGTNIRNWP